MTRTRRTSVKRATAIAALSALLVPPVFGRGWALIGSDHKKLRGQAVAAVGTVSMQTKYLQGSLENLEWFEFDADSGVDFCFLFTGYVGYYGASEKPALLLMDERKNMTLAVLESVVGSIKVEIEEIEAVKCPSRY